MGEDIPLLAEDADGGWEVVEDGSTQVGSPFFGVQVIILTILCLNVQMCQRHTPNVVKKYRESSLTPSL